MRKTMVAGLALMMAFSIISTAALAADKTVETSASISFDQGVLEFIDTGVSGLKNMNIYFGSNSLPLGKIDYYADDGSHTLRVSDPREKAGGWHVIVSLSQFESKEEPATGNTFIGDIELSGSILKITNNLDDTGCTVADPLLIPGNDPSGAEVMSTEEEAFDMGWFDVTWPNGQAKLSIDESNALQITDEAAYVAVMTWTLIDDGT